MKTIFVSVVVSITLVGGVIFLSGRGTQGDSSISADNVSVVEGKQVIELRAKGGYQPRKSVAKARIPTLLRFNTNGTFDCSSSVRIPSMGINKLLPSSGVTDIDLGIPQEGRLQGMCGMGMYPFEINFER